jgi:hypothetical protein
MQQPTNRPGSRKTVAAGIVLAFALLTGCAAQPRLHALSDWQADGHGNFVNKQTGRVITDAQYTELVASEAYVRIHNLGGGQVNYCEISRKR